MIPEIYANLVGFTGGILSILSFSFQLYKIYQDRSTKDLSYLFILFQFLVNLLNAIYGFLIESYPLIICNTIITILVGVLASIKYYIERNISNKILENKTPTVYDGGEFGILEEH